MKKLINYLKEPVTLDELVEKYGKAEDVLKEIKTLRRKGYEIVKDGEWYYFNGRKDEFSEFNNYRLPEGKDFIIGVIGDTHIGSKYFREDFLNSFYEYAKKQGIKHIIHAGDIIDGVSVYSTQTSQLANFTIDDQVNKVIQDYPHLKTYFILGNHDMKQYQKGNSIHPGKVISSNRKDMKWIGDFYSRLQLGKSRIFIDVVHPSGGMAYALSYKMQKYIERLQSGNKPNILLFGHYHTSFYMQYRNIHAFHVGCFQDTNDLTVRMGIQPAIGGWILEGKHNGYEITKLKGEFKTYYR